jgi:hypothetical protein
LGPRDEPSDFEGDSGFFGVEERLPPQDVPPGQVCAARNKRFRNGRGATRDGIALLPWMKGNGLVPFSEVYGAGVFRDPNTQPPATGEEWILIAGDSGAWRTKPNFVARPVPVGDPVALSKGTFAKFLQAAGAILLLRGLGNDVLQCTNLEEGFRPIAQVNAYDVTFDAATNRVGLPSNNLLVGDPVRFTPRGGSLPVAITADATYYVLDTPDADSFTISATPGGPTQVTWNTSATDATVYVGSVTILDGAGPIPPALDGVYVNNRVILITGKDTAVISDIGDFTRYQAATSQFRINLGDANALVAVSVFNEDTVVFFKDGRVLKVQGVSGDLSQALGPLNVTDQYGALGLGSVVPYGNDLYWLSSELRVVNLTLTAFNEEQGTDNALSDPLVQTFGRIHRASAAAARLAVFGGFLHVALPMDDATVVSRTELVGGGLNYSSPTAAVVLAGLTAGKSYRYAQGSTDGRLVNGTETLPGDADFTAQGTSVSLYLAAGLTSGPVMASVKQVLASGVNTAVAVYDFLNQMWCGSDEAVEAADGTLGIDIAVVDWLKFRYGGENRLGYLGADGWLHLTGEGYEDEALVPVSAPYADVLADRLSLLTAGDTLQVNGGTLVTAALSNVNIGASWGVGLGSASSVAGTNLWQDVAGQGGFNPAATVPWTAPNTVASLIEGGVRFTATNGVLPVVAINGTPVTDGFSDWAFLDSHSGSEIASVPIVDQMLTRGYRCQGPNPRQALQLLQTPEVKRYLMLALQLATWSPRYSIRAVGAGVNAGTDEVEGETRDRTKYFAPWDAPAWEPTNQNDDYDNPRREDYSFQMGDAISDSEASGLMLNSGASVDALQEVVHRTPVNERGLWMQLEVTNSDGRVELLASAMEGQDAEVLSGPQVT